MRVKETERKKRKKGEEEPNAVLTKAKRKNEPK